MTVYVDDVQHRFGRMIMCHMWADTEDELLAMAHAIGVQLKWIQGHQTLSIGKAKNASWVHFDISLGMKDKAISRGAVLTDKYGPLVHTKTLMLAWAKANNRPDVAEHAQKWLDRIKALRAS